MSESKKLYVPPIMRFLTELTTWLWLLLSAILICYGFGLLFALSILSLALLNTPGDKRSLDTKTIGLSVPG
ncbi:MAG: hypothetical protein HGN29_07850 [Asgard group archaeon]|nr:hypothetical protein [Asgard group archaeon]